MKMVPQDIANVEDTISKRGLDSDHAGSPKPLSQAEQTLTIQQASQWASKLLDKDITSSNISYLISYGLIDKIEQQKRVLVRTDQLSAYYARKESFPLQPLSFSQYKETQTTKHVHRLHPYKGKFIPQLVEYFLDEHTDDTKKEAVFRRGDLVLDPFCGSGTTLVAANEIGLHALGVEISEFNALIANLKLTEISGSQLQREAARVARVIAPLTPIAFEAELSEMMSAVNEKCFPSPQFRKKLADRSFRDLEYSSEQLEKLLPRFDALKKKHLIPPYAPASESFLDIWCLPSVRKQIKVAIQEINHNSTTSIRDMLRLILSRTLRSCRATTHRDLATLNKPVTKPYYCRKHGKLCHPLFSINRWWNRYAEDTIKRLETFSRLRTDTIQKCFVGDSRNINVIECLSKSKLSSKPIKGIFSSPPYVGMIDYHQQHAYAYEMFGFSRRDKDEIGPMSGGRSRQAREKYVEDIAKVLQNCKRFMIKNHHVFLVANDYYQLYPSIAERARMHIVNRYQRPVLNRAEGDKSAYSETIFHLQSE